MKSPNRMKMTERKGKHGKQVAEISLPRRPVFDGMIAADEKLFISMVDGFVVCLGGRL